MAKNIKQSPRTKTLKNLHQNRAIQVFALIMGCLALGFIDGFRSFASTYINGRLYGKFYDIVRWDVSGWLIWIAFIPLVLWLSSRFPINRKTWRKSLPSFLVLGLLVAVAKTFSPILFYILFFEGLTDLLSWLPDKFFFLITDFITALIFYLLVLTFGQAKNYYKQYRDEELRSSQLEAQLSKAELRALRMQLQPHFLFNVLNSIVALQIENPKTAQEMTVCLGDFLRMTLDNAGAQEIPLEREIDMLKCYLDIQKIRFGNRLSTNIKISSDVLDYQIPNLILQPIVENAIQHGITPQTTPGKIDITAASTSDWLKVEIEDSGSGIKDKDNIFSSGVGLSNTQARLRQSYGENFRFDFGSRNENGSGLLVTLCLPLKRKRAVKEVG